MTPERAAFRKLAQSAKVGDVTRGQLAVLVQNLPCTGLINGTESHLLVVLINTAPADAFGRSGCPIVFKSNVQLAFEIGRSPGRVSRMLSRLYDTGLITMQDSGNYKRYPASANGDTSESCGIDLRVLVARFAELTALVDHLRMEQRLRRAAIRRYRGTLRNVRQARIATDLTDERISLLGRRIDRISRAIGAASDISADSLRKATRLLDWIGERLMGILKVAEHLSTSQDSTCLRVENDMHKQITTLNKFVRSRKEKTTTEAEEAWEATERAGEQSLRHLPPVRHAQTGTAKVMVALRDVLRAAPTIEECGFRPETWGDLCELMPTLCRMAGISEDARRCAIEHMGEQKAAVAVTLTFEKANRRDVNSPGGYLRALAYRAAKGELYLERSVFGLASQPDNRMRTG